MTVTAQMTPAQCRAAREIVDMSQFELAGASLVPTFVIIDYEAGAVTPQPVDLKAMRRALKAAGVEFTDGGRPGVRLRKGGK